MANPITWRNITAPDGGNALTAMSKGADQVRQAFSGLADVSQGLNDQRIANEKEEAIFNDGAIQSFLSGFGSHEEFLEARDSGQIDEIINSIGNTNPDIVAKGLQETEQNLFDRKVALLDQEREAERLGREEERFGWEGEKFEIFKENNALDQEIRELRLRRERLELEQLKNNAGTPEEMANVLATSALSEAIYANNTRANGLVNLASNHNIVLNPETGQWDLSNASESDIEEFSKISESYMAETFNLVGEQRQNLHNSLMQQNIPVDQITKIMKDWEEGISVGQGQEFVEGQVRTQATALARDLYPDNVIINEALRNPGSVLPRTDLTSIDATVSELFGDGLNRSQAQQAAAGLHRLAQRNDIPLPLINTLLQRTADEAANVGKRWWISGNRSETVIKSVEKMIADGDWNETLKQYHQYENQVRSLRNSFDRSGTNLAGDLHGSFRTAVTRRNLSQALPESQEAEPEQQDDGIAPNFRPREVFNRRGRTGIF